MSSRVKIDWNKPRYCYSNQIRCRAIGVLQILGGIYSMYDGSSKIVALEHRKEHLEAEGYFLHNYSGQLAFWIVVLTFAIISFILGLILIIGTHANGNIRICQIWFYSTISLLILSLILQFGIGIALGIFPNLILGQKYLTMILMALSLLIQLYFLWIVNSYIKQLRIMSFETVHHVIYRE